MSEARSYKELPARIVRNASGEFVCAGPLDGPELVWGYPADQTAVPSLIS
jgi:hypothetical protein